MEHVVAGGVVEPQVEHLHEVVDHEGDEDALRVREKGKSHQDHQVHAHDLLRELDAQHAPHDQHHHVHDRQVAVEGQAAVHRRGQVAVGVLRRHLPAQRHLVDRCGIATASYIVRGQLHSRDHVEHASVAHVVEVSERVALPTVRGGESADERSWIVVWIWRMKSEGTNSVFSSLQCPCYGDTTQRTIRHDRTHHNKEYANPWCSYIPDF